MKTSVAVDARLLNRPMSGVGQIATGLIEGLASVADRGDIELKVMVNRGVNFTGSHKGRELRKPAMHLWFPAALALDSVSAGLVPRQTRPLLSFKPVVPLFHDIGFLRVPELYTKDRLRDATTRWAGMSNLSLAVSSYTKSEMAAAGIGRMVVALPIGALRNFTWHPRGDDKFVLCIAAQEPHKNLPRLIDAWARSGISDLSLVLCGRKGRDSARVDRAVATARAAGSRIVLLEAVSDERLTELMAGCWAYVQPSLYEGLCIPAMDMAAAGVPLVVGDESNLGAVFGPAGTGGVTNARSVDELSRALLAIVRDHAYRESVSSSSSRAVGITNWVHVAEVVINEIKKLA